MQITAHSLAAALLLLAICTGCAPNGATPPTAPPESAMDLNRAGKWSEAVQAAQRVLDRGASVPLVARCEAYAHLAYSLVRLGETGKARETLSAFDSICADINGEHWLHREIKKLRAELDSAVSALPGIEGDGFWQTGDAASLGLDSAALREHQELCERTGGDACLVVYRGKIVQEWYSDRYRVPMHAMSSTKSVTALLVGLLVDEGKIKSLDEPVCTFISEWCQGTRSKVTLRHLLTMTAGLPTMREGGVGTVSDKNRFVIGLSPSDEPGTAWNYSNEGVQLLSPILDKAAGEPIQEYARRRLFEPLGMRNTRLHLDAAEHAWTYADMETTPRDMARLGLLMLHDGKWQGRQVISERWVEAATTGSQSLNPRYGLLWWLYGDPQGFAALGHLETNLYVFPKLDLVAVRMQAKPLGAALPGRYEPQALPLFKRINSK